MKKVYLHFSNDRKIKEVTVTNETTVGHLIKEYAKSDANRPDYEEDLEVYFENKEEELSKDCTMEALHIKGGEQLHLSRCRKFCVEISFNGAVFKEHIKPSFTIDKVLLHVLHHFKITPEDGAKLSLFLTAENDDPIPKHEHIGSLTGYPTCGVVLYLAKKKTFQGCK